jgi:hypothetical protein
MSEQAYVPRVLTAHQTNPCNGAIRLEAGEHHYVIHTPVGVQRLDFQNGPIKEVGTNGVTLEVLLTIVADRLRVYQASPFANEWNARSLAHVEGAFAQLCARTAEREARGVEGTHEV